MTPERRYPMQYWDEAKQEWRPAGSLLAASQSEAVQHMARVRGVPVTHIRVRREK